MGATRIDYDQGCHQLVGPGLRIWEDGVDIMANLFDGKIFRGVVALVVSAFFSLPLMHLF